MDCNSAYGNIQGNTMNEIMKKEEILELVPEADKNIVSEISGYFNTVKLGHTDLQIKKFILNNTEYPTDYGKFCQAKLELWTRFECLLSSHYEYHKLQKEIEIEESRIEEKKHILLTAIKSFMKKRINAEIGLCELEIHNKSWRMRTIQKRVSEKIREMHSFYESLKEHEHEFDEDKEELAFWKEKMKTDNTGRIRAYLG